MLSDRGSVRHLLVQIAFVPDRDDTTCELSSQGPSQLADLNIKVKISISLRASVRESGSLYYPSGISKKQPEDRRIGRAEWNFGIVDNEC